MYAPRKSPPIEITEKPDLSVRGLMQWLETQDGATEYDWLDCYGCLAHKYLVALGLRGRTSQQQENPKYLPMLLSSAFGEYNAYVVIGCADPWTFSAALLRCKEYLERSGG